MVRISNKLFILLVILKYACAQISLSVTEQNQVGLCGYCTCSEISEQDGTQVVYNIQCSKIEKSANFPYLDKILWPENQNGLKITASFEGLGLTSIEKLPKNSKLESLSFSNNAIRAYWPDPLQNLPNVKYLSLSQNDLTALSQDLFTNIENLEVLDVSYNKLADINPHDFKHLRNLKRLNFQSNSLKKIPLKALQSLKMLEDLDLSKNDIYDLVLEKEMNDSLTAIRRLNLSGNKIRTLMKDTFPEKNSLEFLDLTNNVIEIIEESTFSSCTKLRELYLGQNKLTFNFELPPSLQIIILRENTIYKWPSFPDGITYIDMSYNKLTDMYPQDSVNFDNLEVLNIAGNQLSEFNVQQKFPLLSSLDLSYNNFAEIPSSLNVQILPAIEELHLDGNLFESIYFKNILAVRSLYMNELNSLMVVDDKAFSNVVGRSSEEYDCFSLQLSRGALVEIKEGAFAGTSVCMLDISHNNLSQLPERLLDWSRVKDGVDLQWNPWDCACHLQWVLKELLPELYQRHPNLLTQFRCNTPRGVQGMRLVHWYNRTDSVMCDDDLLTRESYMIEPSTELRNTHLPKVTSLTLILGAAIIVGLFIAIGLMVYLVKTRRKYKVRQAALKRKRQSALDEKSGKHEQFSALNKT